MGWFSIYLQYLCRYRCIYLYSLRNTNSARSKNNTKIMITGTVKDYTIKTMCSLHTVILCSGTATNIRPHGTGQKWAQPAWGAGLGCSQFHVMSPPPAPAPATPVRGGFQARTCQHAWGGVSGTVKYYFLSKVSWPKKSCTLESKDEARKLQYKQKAWLENNWISVIW